MRGEKTPRPAAARGSGDRDWGHAFEYLQHHVVRERALDQSELTSARSLRRGYRHGDALVIHGEPRPARGQVDARRRRGAVEGLALAEKILVIVLLEEVHPAEDDHLEARGGCPCATHWQVS